MHYFHNLSSDILGALPQTLTHPWTYTRWPLGDFCSQTPNLPTPGKILRTPMV